MRKLNDITTQDQFDTGVKLITAEQRAQCAVLAAIYLERFRLCSPDQAALATTFRLGALLLQEIAE